MAAGSLRYALRCCRQQGRPPLFPTVKNMIPNFQIIP
jgi:hypothetical protein